MDLFNGVRGANKKKKTKLAHMRRIACGNRTGGLHVLRPSTRRVAPEASSPVALDGLEEDGIYHTEGLQKGRLPAMLWDVLQELGYEKEPTYVGERTSGPDDHPTWNVKVQLFRPCPEAARGAHEVYAVYHTSGPRATFFRGISDAARHALLDVCSQNREALADTRFAFFPQRALGASEITARPVPAEEESTLFGKLVALGVQLNNELDSTEQEIKYMRGKIAQNQRRIQELEARSAEFRRIPSGHE